MSETETRQFEALLNLLKQNRGFDFTGYKRTTLVRRVRKRMSTIGIDDFEKYSDYIEVHSDEYNQLFNTILINVTAFLRDPEAWEALQRDVIQKLAAKPEDEQIRVWTAGCASGQETYTLIMVLAEALGVDRFKKQVKVYATDADQEALAQARAACYTARELESLPEEWRETYFEPVNNDFVFRQDLRRCVIFGEHDLVQDAPISRLDLLICRNTLIYFNSETQGRILARFHFALSEDAFLFVGKSEMLLTHSRLYTPVDARARIFAKVPRANYRETLLLAPDNGATSPTILGNGSQRLRESGFDSAPIGQIVLDQAGIVVLANHVARTTFRIGMRDLGRAIQDLEVSYRPIELRSRIEEAHSRKATVIVADVEHRIGQDTRYFDVHVSPLLDEDNTVNGATVSFFDVTNYHAMRLELERSSHELEAAYEELQATNEELETTNEELQSTIEELETTNEELQSTNEELETMNEELQSTNEELETINEELRRRTNELNGANDFLETVLTSMRAGVAVTDVNLNISLWNLKAEDLWGLRSDEAVGKPLLSLDIGLPVDELAKMMRDCLAGKSDNSHVIVPATNRRGRPIQCRVTCARLMRPQSKIDGLILFMEEWGQV